MGKEPNTDHNYFPLFLNPQPFYRPAPAFYDIKQVRQQPLEPHAIVKNDLLTKKAQRKKEILQFSTTPSTPGIFIFIFFKIQQQHCYTKHSPQQEVQGHLRVFYLAVLPTHYTV